MRSLGLIVLSAYLLLSAAVFVVVAPLDARMALGRPVANASLVMLPQIITALVAHLIIVTGALGVYVATARWFLRIPAPELSSTFMFSCLSVGHAVFLLQTAVTLVWLTYIQQQSGWNILDAEAVRRTADLIVRLQPFRVIGWSLLFAAANALIAKHMSRGQVSTQLAFGIPTVIAYLVVDILTLPQ